jgi:hypothetical protein
MKLVKVQISNREEVDNWKAPNWCIINRQSRIGHFFKHLKGKVKNRWGLHVGQR